jgi:hypothetical protein
MIEQNECETCESQNVKFVKYEMSNKIKILRKQCFDCGHINGRNYKRSFVNNFNLLMDADIILRNKRYEIQAKKHKIKNILYDYSRDHFERQKKYYNETYLNSEEWKHKRKLMMDFYKGKCQKCNSFATDMHHLTYDNIFKEKFDDLIPLCRNCHQKEHTKKN